MNTVRFVLCDSCSEILTQGYTDSINDPDRHLMAVYRVEQLLPGAGYYFLGHTDTIEEDYTTTCEGCNVHGVTRTCYAEQDKRHHHAN